MRYILIMVLALAVVSVALATSDKVQKQANPYELILIDDKVVFDEPNKISMKLLVRDLGVKKMIAPHLYWALSLEWDGKKYVRDAKAPRVWSGPWEIIPKTAWRTGISFSKYHLPSEALTPGKHVLLVKDGFAKSNSVTIFIKEREETR